MKNQAHLAVLLALLILIGGCRLFEEEPVILDIDTRTYPEDGYTAVQRVLILPFSNETPDPVSMEVVEEAFARDLADRGCFELITLPRSEYPFLDSQELSRAGRFPLTVLIELGNLYHVDAVILGSLKIYNPYAPPAIGLKADLISVRTGAVLRTVNGLLDARDSNVHRDIVRYYEEQMSRGEDSLFEWRLVTTSPSVYARYACNRFLNAMYPEKIKKGDGGEIPLYEKLF